MADTCLTSGASPAEQGELLQPHLLTPDEMPEVPDGMLGLGQYRMAEGETPAGLVQKYATGERPPRAATRSGRALGQGNRYVTPRPSRPEPSPYAAV